MRRILLTCVLMLTGAAHAQLPTLPQLWVDNNECNANYSYELTFPGTWISGAPAGWPTVLPYANTAAGVQQAITDMEAYRTVHGTGTRLHIPAGFLYSSTMGPWINQTNTVPATQCNVIDSTDDALLPNGQTVCSHGIQDNLATSTDPGLDNPDCTGKNMYYQLGDGASGARLTTVSSHTTTLAAITANASPQLVPLANGFVSVGNAYTLGSGGTLETVVAVSGVNQTGLYAVFTKNHPSGEVVTFDFFNVTLANGTVVSTSSFNDVKHMWTVECTTSNCAGARFCAPVGGGSSSSAVPACGNGSIAPDHWLIMDMEARPKAVFISTGVAATPVLMSGSGSETSSSQFPQHIHLRKNWAHSDWTSLATGLNAIANGFYLNCSYCSLVDSQVSQSLYPGSESHSILANGVGPYKINHNWPEGSSIGMFSGGTCSTWPSPTYVPLQDAEVRRNRFTFPYAWLGASITGNAHWSGSKTRKNVFEIKSAERLLRDGNIMENDDSSGGQNGTLGDFNVRNNSCSAGTNYNTIIEDVLASNETSRNGCENWEADNSSGVGSGSGNGRTYGVYRLAFINGVTYNNSAATGAGCSGVVNRGLVFSNGSGIEWQGTITGNGTTATFVANCDTNEGNCVGQVASIAINSAGTGCSGNGNFTVGAPNLSGGAQASGSYTCSGGALATVTLGSKGSGYTSAPTYTPATGTGTVTVTMNSSSTTPGTGYQALSMLIGDPVAITRCSVTSAFNNVTQTTTNGHTIPNQRGPLATTGSTPWNGTPSAANLTVSYPSAVNGSDNGGFCALNVEQGGPNGLTIRHMTVIADTLGSAISTNAAPSTGYNFAPSAAIIDSLLLGAGLGQSALTEGTQSTGFLYDTSTLSMHHSAFPTRTASSYTEYGNNSNFTDSAGCTGAGCHNPVTIYFPTTPWATGATCSSANVCFAGAEYKNASAIVLSPADYHDVALDATSVFKGGQSQQASDGTDMGANIPAIDTAQTLNLYVCGTSCGTGPYMDVKPPVISAPVPIMAGGTTVSGKVTVAGQ